MPLPLPVTSYCQHWTRSKGALTANAAPNINRPMQPAPRAAPVVLAAAAFYAAFTLTALALHGWNPLWFVWIGARYAEGDPSGLTGYDGQFIYYIARDGWAALEHLDNPPYRLQRILYPLLTRALSAGNAAAMPWAMVAINAAAILTTTFLVTRWLVAHGLWRWYGLVYPLFVGTVMAYSRDLTEPLACTLALAGVLCWLDERRAAAVVLFALAGLARESTTLFVAALALAELVQRRWPRAVALGAALVPMLAWQFYLGTTLAAFPIETARLRFPAAGMFTDLSLEPGRISALIFIGLPTLALVPLAVRGVIRAPGDAVAWLVALHCGFALLSPANSNLHVLVIGRLSAFLLLALLLAFPRYSPAVRAAVSTWSIVPTLIWLPPILWWAPWTAKF